MSTADPLADVALGAAAGLWRLGRLAGRPVVAGAGAIAHGVLGVADRLRPGTSSALGARGRHARTDLEDGAEALLTLVAHRLLDVVLNSLDLNELIRRHVDLDALAAELDVDAVVARVDLDAAVAGVDLDAAVERVDLDRAVARVDLDAVARRLDLAAILARVDPNPLIGVVDFDAALARIDLVGLTRDVMDAVDLPEIVRDATGTLSSDAVRTVRAGGMAADDRVAGFVDRLLRRGPVRGEVLP